MTIEELYEKLEKEYGETYWIGNYFDKLGRYIITIESNHFKISIPENNEFISFYEINKIMNFIKFQKNK